MSSVQGVLAYRPALIRTFHHHGGIYSPLILMVYLVSMRVVYSYGHRTLSEFVDAAAERYPDATLRCAIKGYMWATLAVVLADSWLPFIAKDIAAMMGWEQSFVGTLLATQAESH